MFKKLAANRINFGFSDGKPDKPVTKIDFPGVPIIRANVKSFAYNRTLAFNNLLIIL